MEQSAQPEEHEGERYLQMLGLSHLANVVVHARGKTIQARDFLEICGDEARPALAGFERMSQDDPRYEIARNALVNRISGFLQPPEQAK